VTIARVISRSSSLTFFLTSTFAVLSASSAAAQAKVDRPNVLIILTDDQGSIDVNCYGAKDLATPHLDGLAKRGVRFTQFYAAAPVCSPSRAALLTGRYPQRAQLATNAGSQPGQNGMPGTQDTIAEMMKRAGYATGHVGKWHLGFVPEAMPNGQGFDYSFGHMGGCIDNYSHFFYWNGPNRHDLWRNGTEIWADGQYFPDLMVQQCKAFITANQVNPFLLYWAINVPHYPLQGTEKWRQHYAALAPPRREYAAFVSTMDDCIGQVLSHLRMLGLEENTVVIFQSDHGHSTEVRTFGGGGDAGPYRGAKFSLFEGGIRVPAIVSWPPHIPRGEVRSQLCTAVDWLPTVADLCQVELPTSRIDGKSLRPILRAADAADAHEVFHWQSGRGLAGKKQWAVRRGPWKLIGNPSDTSKLARLEADDELFLVNLDFDPCELCNVGRDHPDIVESLLQLHQQWLEDVPNQ
jgi:arylsulfatase A